LDCLLQYGELLLFELSKLVHPLPLSDTVSREIVKSGQSGIDSRGRFLVWHQVDRIIRNQVSTLACFRINHKAENSTQLFLHFVGSLNLIVQPVITQGGTAGVRNHPKSEEQPNSEDYEQTSLQSS